jgi:2-polyprenyl-3-methyl-5-hydroxy-6-metoxy-1,4-benzoquinol methylase
MKKTVSCVKKTVKYIFQIFGFKISRISSPKPLAAKYFNTGRLNPIEENSVMLYDSFYKDAEAVEDYYRSERVAFYKEVVDHFKCHGLNLDGKIVADMGCGVGYLLSEINNNFSPKSLTGYDFSKEAVDFSRKKFPDSSFVVHDIYDALQSSYDFIFCTEVIEHLESPHLALRNLLSAINPAGVLILTVPNGRIDNLIEHINFWSPESWRAFLSRECQDMTISTSTLFDGKVNFAIVKRS